MTVPMTIALMPLTRHSIWTMVNGIKKWISAILVLSACSSPQPSPAPVTENTSHDEMCWLSTKDISRFDMRQPRKYVTSPRVDGREVTALGIHVNGKNQAVAVGVWLEKEDSALSTPVAPENQSDVTKQVIALDAKGNSNLKIDSTRASRTSDATWIWQGEITVPSKKPQHVYLFCSRVM